MTQIYTSFYQAQQTLADIEAIDYFFAGEMKTALASQFDLTVEQEQLLMHLFIALSVSLRAGHSCLPITEICDSHWAVAFDEQGQCSHQGYIFPSSDFLSLLLTKLNIGASAEQPLVFDQNKLYMRRYFQFESQLAQDINQRLAQPTSTSLADISLIVSQLFPEQQSSSMQQQEINWQQVAVANAINKNFAVIAGGPGTGKTYTVTKLLAALLMLNEKRRLNANNGSNDEQHSLEIALVAPTGKAAQRLSESIIKAIAGFKGLIADDILALMPTQAKTIHRLLGVIPNSPNFRHNQEQQLSCDVLLIDEVSMVDLPMMARIFRALKPQTKVILLGDADQLPSVAVGSVLADIAPRPHCGYSNVNLNYLAQVCQIEQKQLQASFEPNSHDCGSSYDHLSFLLKSRRFDNEGDIGKLAGQVIKSQARPSWQLLTSSKIVEASTNEESSTRKKSSDSEESSTSKAENQLSLVDHNLDSWLAPLVKKYYQGIAQCNDVDQAFIMLAKFRVLCVTRQGEFGVDAINQWVKNKLVDGSSVYSNNTYSSNPYQNNSAQTGYHGMPIMISENNYRLALFNGDIGILWRTSDGHLMAFFESVSLEKVPEQKHKQTQENSYKMILPSRLPKYDSVYAMTIHKTQGSEFEHVAIVLPQQAGHQLLSRELLYTGITRAKTKLTIASNSQTWQQGVKTAIKRFSGLSL